MPSSKDKKDKQTTEMSRRAVLVASGAGGVALLAATGLPGCGGSEGGGGGQGGETPPIETTLGPVQWGMYLNLARCVGCKACVIACKVENEVPLGAWRREVKELEVGTYPAVERRSLPWLCNHCDSPPCVTRCSADPICASQAFPDGTELAYLKRATYKRPDGLVLVDEERCIGCGNCIEDCPYGARFANPNKAAADSELANAGDYVSNKCTFCVNRTEGGVVPACVQTCPAEALMFGDIADPDSDISKAIAADGAVPLIAAYGTEPRTRYSGYESSEIDAIFADGTDVKNERCLLDAQSDDPSCRVGS